MSGRLTLLALLLACSAASFADQTLLEYQVKAVCILNAARFVSWPASAFEGSNAPLVIGIIGENPFGSTLEEVVKGETLQNRRIQIRRVSLEEAAKVHVLFISNSERDHLDQVLRAVGDASVLTISEIKRFSQSGGMLGLSVVRDRIRFEINAEAARRAQLKIDAQFLLLARGNRGTPP